MKKGRIVCVRIGTPRCGFWAQAETTIKGLLKEGKSRMVFDLGQMDYISSAGLRVILMTVKELQSRKGKVVLSALTPYVREIFDVSNFSSIIPITDTVEAGFQKV
jgi:anti-anti-sigma factor